MQYYTLKSKYYPERELPWLRFAVLVVVVVYKSINDFMSFRRPLNCL